MSNETIKSIQEMIDSSPPTDNRKVHERLWKTMQSLYQQIANKTELVLDPTTEAFRNYSSHDGAAIGQQRTYKGPDIAYLALAWTGNPDLGFYNIHLNVWVAPHIDIPHFGCVFGTLPDLFFFTDYVPRHDMWFELETMDKYYEPLNERHLEIIGRSDIKPFTSQSTYIRQAASPVAVGFSSDIDEEKLTLIETVAQERLSLWLQWLGEAPAVAKDKQDAMARRDYLIRLANGKRDPANPVATKMFGKEMSEKLLEGLWGVNWKDELY